MFKGAITAIVTPFTREGKFDEEAFRKLIGFQIENNIDGIVPCGTTGESPTLSNEEKLRVIRVAVEAANGRVPIIAGSGGYDTNEAIEMTKKAKEMGADASLQICPYYNKPTQEGLYRHFSKIAKAVDIPIIIYNIKGRTAVNMETSTLLRLAKENPNIIGVKEASGDINQMMEVINTLPEDFSVLSGDDNLAFPLIALGGKGVISVASNLIPKEMHELVDCALNKNLEKAREMHYKFLPLFKGIFIETNPIPIKTALSMKGLIEKSFRLPMCEMKPENEEKLRRILENLKI